MRALTREPWLAYTIPKPEALIRLFCFPAAGAGASLFRQWVSLLPDEIEVCPVQLPGRETRWGEKPFTRLVPLIDALRSALRPYLDKPFAFFGCSLGGMVAFELARLLLLDGLSPVHLFVAAMMGPPFTLKRRLHDLPEREFRSQLGELGGTSSEVLENAELMKLFAPLLRADFAIAETCTFAPGAVLACPLSVYGGLADAECRPDQLPAWQAHTTGSFRLRMFAGGHFFLNTAQSELFQAITEDLQPAIARLQERR